MKDISLLVFALAAFSCASLFSSEQANNKENDPCMLFDTCYEDLLWKDIANEIEKTHIVKKHNYLTQTINELFPPKIPLIPFLEYALNQSDILKTEFSQYQPANQYRKRKLKIELLLLITQLKRIDTLNTKDEIGTTIYQDRINILSEWKKNNFSPHQPDFKTIQFSPISE